SGIWLAMNYTPTETGAFASVEYIMRDMNYGWLIRYMHTTGASFFFIVVYLHMFRAIIYGSHRKPRELIWLIGMAIFITLMAAAFTGYLLPWGQMSFWGAQVITSLFGAIPYVGEDLMTWVRGDFNVSGTTLNRYFALHVVVFPIILLILVYLHIIALHTVGSNNPDGIEIKKLKDEAGHPLDGIRFHPYYTVKDLVGVIVFLIIFSAVLFFHPEMNGFFIEYANYAPADWLKTPEHVAPVWYMTPFYSVLRAVPNKLGGVMAMGAAIAFLFVIPWLDRSKVKSIRYRGIYFKIAITIFVVSFIVLAYLGTQAPSQVKTLLARVFTTTYFLFFILMPVYTYFDKTKPVPERVR
ncbi:MAG TPA: cytochrome b N-terminal domain-containing protein, partial [Gammaproteobacteria bacterium]|nr:cytochrome b N-terminal domain-containing protein [Gammaproteobacteria bacterium]